MEKSIEAIWKEGFLRSNALVAPKVNDLYNKKSIFIVDKFKKMYKINRIALVGFACFILPMSMFFGMPSMGIMMFILFITIAILAYRASKQLNKISQNTSSYEYLTSFNAWIKRMIKLNGKMSRLLYPYVFIATVSGIWFLDVNGDYAGDKLVDFLIKEFPDMYLVMGVPIILIILFIIGLVLLTFFGAKIGKWDINLVYGRVLRKLEELIADMEELRAA